MTTKTAAVLAALVLCAVSSRAQTVSWDDGRDLLAQLRASADAPAIATPVSVPAAPAPLGSGLVVHATEIGMAKFHRRDNQVHPYPAGSAWIDDVAPDGDLSATPIVREDADGAVSVYYSNLEELLRALVDLSRSRNARISVLNVNSHGIPGGVWFPKDAAQARKGECGDWRKAATGPDKHNYDQYYSLPPKNSILALRKIAVSDTGYTCTTGTKAWIEVAARVPGLKDAFADDARVQFHACLLGLGPAGERFTKTIAGLLLSGKTATVTTSMAFGLGDWSTPEGMGFWDYEDDWQLQHDADRYSTTRKDRDIMRKGSIRVAFNTGGDWSTRVVGGLQFMTPAAAAASSAPVAANEKGPNDHGSEKLEAVLTTGESDGVRLPGTDAVLTPL